MTESETWYESQPGASIWPSVRAKAYGGFFLVLLYLLVGLFLFQSSTLLTETLLLLTIPVVMLAIVIKMENNTQLAWNERAFRRRTFVYLVREFEWLDLKSVRQSAMSAALVLEFKNGKTVKIRADSRWIRREDYNAFEEFAKRKLKENARTS